MRPKPNENDIRLVSELAAVSMWGEGVAVDWLGRIERKGSLTPKQRETARRILRQNAAAKPVKRTSQGDEDRALVLEAAQENDWFAGVKDSWLKRIDAKGELTPDQRAHAQREVQGRANLKRALGEADLRAIIADTYPDAGVNREREKQYIKGVWRSGETKRKVLLFKDGLKEVKSGDYYNVWDFLTQIVYADPKDAAADLLYRAGLSTVVPSGKVATKLTKFEATPKGPSEADLRTERYKAERLASAKALHPVGPRTGRRAYLTRKQVEGFGSTHHVLHGLVYGEDKYGRFVQVAVTNLSEIVGYQRIYDTRCIRNRDGDRRDKDFIGSVWGGAVVLLPNGVSALPEDGVALARLLWRGYRVGACEGVATGLSICIANPKTLMFCTLNAGNLVAFMEVWRARYGYEARWSEAGESVRQVIGFDAWADDDKWQKDHETGEKIPVPKPISPREGVTEDVNAGMTKAYEAARLYKARVMRPKFSKWAEQHCPTDFNDLHRYEGLERLRLAPERPATNQDVNVYQRDGKKPVPESRTGQAWRTLGGLGVGLFSIAAFLLALFTLLGNSPAALGLGWLEPLVSGWRTGALLASSVAGIVFSFMLMMDESEEEE